MKKMICGMAMFCLLACSSDDSSSAEASPEPITVNWSISGVFGGGQVDSVYADMNVDGLVSRLGSSTVHLNGYDTTYFENNISLSHLQIGTFVKAEIDADGNFTFDNLELFGLCDGMNSVKITPHAKPNVILNPTSFILYNMYR
ncbi:MAG: hypothetical protein HUK20_08530 [Fibrobacter sp.]|nr:hypothetical protein [Fibrobacter sp.]